MWQTVQMCVVQLRCNIFEIATILNEFNQNLERKKNLSLLIYVLKKFDKLPIRKFYVFYFMSTFCLAYVTSSAWIKNIVCKIYFGILSITLILKFNLSTEFFLQVERTFLVRRVQQKLSFLTHFIAYAWLQNISKQFKAP